MSIKIWVDGQCFQTGSNVRGIGRYVIDFLKSISKHNVGLIISLNGSMKQETIAARRYIERELPGSDVDVWFGISSDGELYRGYCSERMTNEKILKAHINSINPDIALSPSPFEGSIDCSNPFIKVDGVNAHTACIFYDAIPHRFPDVYLKEESAYNLYYRRFDEISNFDLVLCISDFTESEYREIHNKENSASISAGLSTEISTLIQSWQYNPSSLGATLGGYVVYVGGMDWRKNVPCLVKAMAHLPQCKSSDLKLVLVGDFGDEYIQPLRAIFEEYGIPKECLVTTGYISDKDLVDLYKNAIASVQPSRMEGFGLGALEAMACGTPFFSAYGGAVGEVVQSNKQMFDPDNHYSLAELLQKLISNEQFKKEVVEHGYLRVNEFSWEKAGAIAALKLEELAKNADKIDSLGLPVTSNPVEDSPRLIMDVTATAESPVMSGIQRVMHNLSSHVILQNKDEGESTKTVLSYCKDRTGWYKLAELSKESVQLNPQNRLNFQKNDSYLLLDSSWTFLEGQGERITDAMVIGQDVVNGVYDIGPLTMPAMTNEGMPPAFRCWMEFILGYSTGIVCISKAVADEMYQLIQDIKLPRPMKIGYFRLGADFSSANPDDSELQFKKERPTFLMVGTIEPRKGQYYGLKAFERLWDQGVDINLMIIGKAGWDTKMFQTMLDNHPEKDKRLFWRDGVSDAGLAAAYQHADALVMTSYLEGFGLPVVEAGVNNTPVILCDLPVFREVGEGAPKACYFTTGSVDSLVEAITYFVDEELDVDYAQVEVNWPSWGESAQELKDVVLNDNWYKCYEPEQIRPNVKLGDVGTITIDRWLSENEIQHELRVVEGPFLSNDGTHLRLAVGVKNLSDMLWSSNIGNPEGLGVNLSYHLYDKNHNCIVHDNPRSTIPFVLSSGQELLMPVRISTDELVKGVSSVGLELVQEGVRWFGNELKVNLMTPYVSTHSNQLLDGSQNSDATELVFFRGPFGKNTSVEKYFLFAVINSSRGVLEYSEADVDKFSYSLVDHEGGEHSRGIWAVNKFDSIEPYNSGYLVLFTNAKMLENSESIRVTYEGCSWLFNIENESIEKIVKPAQIPLQVDVSLKAPEINNETAWLDSFDQESAVSNEISLSFSEDSNVSLRGFNQLEGTHVWMGGASGEIDLDTELPDNVYIKQIKVICAPYNELTGPVELSLLIGDNLVDKKQLSHDFMEYIYELDIDENRELMKNNFRINLLTARAMQESGGERMLSVCFAKISLLVLTD